MVCFIFVAIAVRTYFAFVPFGAEFGPWAYGRVDGPVLHSPDGREISVYFNDAGAMHSGNHWTWFVEESLWFGRRVVAQGYLGANVRRSEAALPIVWQADGSLAVDFLPKRYSN